MRRNHNDYEIIARVKEGDDGAFELMVSKYTRFIAKIIHKFNLAYQFEDLHQEGLLQLYQLCLKFDERYNKTFTRFFEMSFERFLITHIDTMKRRKHKTVYYHDCIVKRVHCVHEPSVYYGVHLDEIKPILTSREFRVYKARELSNLSVNHICESESLPVKTVYNIIQRAKFKIRQHFAKD